MSCFSCFMMAFLARIHTDILSKETERLNDLETLLHSDGNALAQIDIEKQAYNARLAELQVRNIATPKLIDWGVLDEIGFHRELKKMFRIKFKEDDELVIICRAWLQAFKVKEDVYKEWCLEFFSTLCVDEQIKVEHIAKEVAVGSCTIAYLIDLSLLCDLLEVLNPVRAFMKSLESTSSSWLIMDLCMELPMAEKTCIGRITTPSGCDFYLCNHGCDVKNGPDCRRSSFINTICICYIKCLRSLDLNMDAGNYGAFPLPSDAL
ncbi:hypothetical protein Tco_1256709 [Tanacetum coccineum]